MIVKRKPICVGAIGMEEDSLARMKLVFTMNYKGQCKLTELSEAEIILVETHAKNDSELKALKKTLLEYPNTPIIFIGSKMDSYQGIQNIDYPPKIHGMWDLIVELTDNQSMNDASFQRGRILRQLKTVDVESTSDVTNNTIQKYGNETTSKDHFFNIDDFLLGKIQDAISESKQKKLTVQIKCWKNRRIVFFPESGVILSDLKKSQLRNLGLIQVIHSNEIEMVEFTTETMRTFSQRQIEEVWVLPVEILMWNLAARTSRGRLPLGSSLDEVYQLKNWPNFTRLEYTPCDIQIAAYWSKEPLSINQISQLLNIDQEHIYTFYTAALAVGLFEKTKTPQQSVTNIPAKKPQRQPIITNILNTLANITQRH